MPCRRFFLAVSLMIVASPAAAQRVAVPGDTVRLIVSARGMSVRGVLGEINSQTVRLGVAPGDDRQIPVAEVRAVRILEGRQPASGSGARAGFGIGAAAGGLLGLAASARSGGFIDFGPEIAIGTAAIGGLMGAFVGVIVGSAAREDRWVPGRVTPPGTIARAPKLVTMIAPAVRMGAESTVLMGLSLRH